MQTLNAPIVKSMSDPAVFHVVPSGEVWAIKRRGDSDAARLAATREQAIEQARAFAAREAPARIVLHRDDGTIESQTNVDAPAPRDWSEWVTSPPVLVGIAGALIVSAVAAVFAWQR